MANRKQALGFDRLEDRYVPAGNVTGVVVDGTLILTGDFDHNRIMITMPGGVGTYTVEGTQEAAWGETTINGMDEDTFAGVTSIKTVMNEGKDYVFVNGDVAQGAPGPFVLLGDLVITTQAGEDNIGVEDATIHGITSVVSSSEKDIIQLIDSVLKKDLTVRAGNGDDLLGIFRSTSEAATSVAMHEGFDDVLFGAESFGLDGATFKGAASVDLGLGENTFESNASAFEDAFFLMGGDGKDGLTIKASTFEKRAEIRGSTGSDLLSIRESTFEADLVVKMARGKDVVEAFDSSFLGLASFAGGLGLDTLDIGLIVPDNGNVLTVVETEAFEVVT